MSDLTKLITILQLSFLYFDIEKETLENYAKTFLNDTIKNKNFSSLFTIVN